MGQAFFHAGARALLVSNWPVHTNATKELMVSLFRRNASGGSKARALRHAMRELISSGSFKDEKRKMLFSYAHPIFWAPFTLVGDGGATVRIN